MKKLLLLIIPFTLFGGSVNITDYDQFKFKATITTFSSEKNSYIRNYLKGNILIDYINNQVVTTELVNITTGSIYEIDESEFVPLIKFVLNNKKVGLLFKLVAHNDDTKLVLLLSGNGNTKSLNINRKKSLVLSSATGSIVGVDDSSESPINGTWSIKRISAK